MVYQKNKTYTVGAYERLSKEDNSTETSSSINSQRMIIESFSKFNHFDIYKHYSDDGYSGSNFDRPAFKELIEDIEKGIINCVIVKDISRLGRELYSTGKYIEDFFLVKGVRFIAINDGFDSDVGDDVLGLRLSINDMYLRDASKKVRVSLESKRKRGEYLGTYPKYGYLKDPENPKHLIVDPITSPIVKQIFEWALNGEGYTSIANRLTEMKILNPISYFDQIYNKKRLVTTYNGEPWKAETIKTILTSEIYLGHMVQGKQRKVSYRSKKRIKLPEEEWIIVKNTHEAIIDEETFRQVQAILNRNAKYRSDSKNKRHLFQGLIVCKECGHQIGIYQRKLKKSSYYFTQCNHFNRNAKDNVCCSHIVRYEPLEQEILSHIRNVCQNFLKEYDASILANKTYEYVLKSKEGFASKISIIKTQIQNLENILSRLYEDKLNGIITAQQYTRYSKKYEKMIDDLEKEMNSLELQLANTTEESVTSEINKITTLLKQFILMENPTNELMFRLIDKIELDKDGNVDVHFLVDMKKYAL